MGWQEILNPSITRDNFLDAEQDIFDYYENFWKILNQSDNFQKILFIDFFSPWLDILQYLSEARWTKIKLWALLHGWSFLPRDLYKWNRLKYSEALWFDIFDVVYVPSRHLYNMVPEQFREKVKIMPRGVDSFLVKESIVCKNIEKNIDILFPHRLDDDKGIDDLIYIVSNLPHFSFTITSFKPLINNEYYNLLRKYKNVKFIFWETEEQHLQTLSRAKIVLSCAYQENFGYSIVKSVLSWAIPVLPNREVYPEFFPKSFLYNNLDHAVKNIEDIMLHQEKYLSLTNEIKPILKDISNFSFSQILNDFYST